MQVKHSTHFAREALFDAMVNRRTVNVGGVNGLINSIECEDGSGHCFNVKLTSQGKTFVIFVRG